jgi:molecular chaperone DnaJ
MARGCAFLKKGTQEYAMALLETYTSIYLLRKTQSFSGMGINVLSEIKISYLQAILGCRLEVNTVDGPVELTIPPGTQPGTVLTLENHGVPKLGNP